MIFAKMPTEKEISKNETLNISPSLVRIFITNAIRIGFTHSLWSVYFWHTCFCLLSQNVKQGRSNISIRSAPILPFSTNTILPQLSLLLCKFNNNTKSLRIFSTTIVLFLHAALQWISIIIHNLRSGIFDTLLATIHLPFCVIHTFVPFGIGVPSAIGII